MEENEASNWKVDRMVSSVINAFASEIYRRLVSFSRPACIGIADSLRKRQTILVGISVKIALGTSKHIRRKTRVTAVERGIANSFNNTSASGKGMRWLPRSHLSQSDGRSHRKSMLQQYIARLARLSAGGRRW